MDDKSSAEKDFQLMGYLRLKTEWDQTATFPKE